ncbi:MAG TPA: GNAT family N-acetyltransferase [Allosphingosinicella sp.]
MSPITLRRAEPDDWAAVAALHAASWRSAYRGIYPDAYLDEQAPEERRAFWRAMLAEMDPEIDILFLAEDAEGPVGFVCLRRKAEAAGPLLDNLHVLPERKGEGIGRRLIAAAADRGGGGVAGGEGARRGAAARRVGEQCRGAGLLRASRRPRGRGFRGADEGGGTASQLRVRWERAAELLPDARHVPGTEEKSHVPGTEEKS